MGPNILSMVADNCDKLVVGTSPTIDVIGIRMLLGLATIMVVWFGLQEALSAAHGGPGFHMGKFLNFFMLISFAYVFVYYYDSSIPGFGYSLTGYIRQGTSSLADTIGTDSANSILNAVQTTLSKDGPNMTFMTSPYAVIVYSVTQVMLSLLSALVAAIIAYGAIAATIVGLLGPIFIPFMIFDKTEFLFWGWLKAYISFEFYKVVAAATLNVLGGLFVSYYQNLTNVQNMDQMVQNFPILLLLIIVCAFILIKIPALTASLFSGSSSGHDAGMGIAMMAMRAL